MLFLSATGRLKRRPYGKDEVVPYYFAVDRPVGAAHEPRWLKEPKQ